MKNLERGLNSTGETLSSFWVLSVAYFNLSFSNSFSLLICLGIDITSSSLFHLTLLVLKVVWSYEDVIAFDSSLILSNSDESKGSSNPSSAFEKYFPALYFDIIQGPISVDLLITFHFSICLLFSLFVVDLKLRIDHAWV